MHFWTLCWEAISIAFFLSLLPTCSFTSHDLHCAQGSEVLSLFCLLALGLLPPMFWIKSKHIIDNQSVREGTPVVLTSGHWECFHGWLLLWMAPSTIALRSPMQMQIALWTPNNFLNAETSGPPLTGSLAAEKCLAHHATLASTRLTSPLDRVLETQVRRPTLVPVLPHVQS